MADLAVVASWVGTEADCRLWAGPAVSFPLESRRLADEIGFAAAENLVLDDDAGPAAFGQAVPMPARRTHLARIIVRPDARGRGLGRALVDALLARAPAGGASVVSLNVYAANSAARRLYEAAGFVEAPWPEAGEAPPGIVHLLLER